MVDGAGGRRQRQVRRGERCHRRPVSCRLRELLQQSGKAAAHTSRRLLREQPTACVCTCTPACARLNETMRRYGPWPPANDPTTVNRQRVAHPLRTDCLSGSFSTLPETPNCGQFGESPAAGSGYQSRELGTGSQRPPSRIDCWLIRPGRVMSIASWMPSGASASPRTPLPSRTSGALRRAAAPARPCYSRSDRYHCSRARQVPP